MEVITKCIRGIWYCSGTIDGYDHLFEGDSIESVQSQMKDLLIRKLSNGRLTEAQLENVKWEAPEIIKHEKRIIEKPYIGQKGWSPKIDNL